MYMYRYMYMYIYLHLLASGNVIRSTRLRFLRSFSYKKIGWVLILILGEHHTLKLVSVVGPISTYFFLLHTKHLC